MPQAVLRTNVIGVNPRGTGNRPKILKALFIKRLFWWKRLFVVSLQTSRVPGATAHCSIILYRAIANVRSFGQALFEAGQNYDPLHT